jgi:hypothetical protein
MKKFFFSASCFVLCAAALNAQMVVVDAALNSLMAATKIEQAANFALMIKQQAESALTAYNQLQALIRQGEAVVQNLKRFKDIRSFDEFMRWHNRQLALEQSAERKFNNIGIKIGDKTVNLKDLKNLPATMRETYVDYWDKEFTEEQKREMWITLGMSPAAYAYQKTWQARLDAAQTKFLGAAEVTNEENMKANEADRAKKEALAREDIGANEIAAIQADTLIDMARQQRDAALDEAAWREHLIDVEKSKEVIVAPPDLSESWNLNPYSPITGKE